MLLHTGGTIGAGTGAGAGADTGAKEGAGCGANAGAGAGADALPMLGRTIAPPNNPDKGAGAGAGARAAITAYMIGTNWHVTT